MQKKIKNRLRGTFRAPAASRKGVSGTGGGKIAETPTDHAPCLCTQPVTLARYRLGTYFSSVTSPPFRPALQVKYPPSIDPAIAQNASQTAVTAVVPRCADSNNSSRSVLPGNGSGITEESTTDTAKIPNPPRLASHRKSGERCDAATWRPASPAAFVADCSHSIMHSSASLSPRVRCNFIQIVYDPAKLDAKSPKIDSPVHPRRHGNKLTSIPSSQISYPDRRGSGATQKLRVHSSF